MRAYVFPTDREWATFLRARPEIREVNFWVPSATTFKALTPGQPFLFKSKAADGNRLIGGGLFSGFTTLSVSEAWATYAEGNGSPTQSQLLGRINAYRYRTGAQPDADPQIGCILLREVFWAPRNGEIDTPLSLQVSGMVRGRSFDPSHQDYRYIEQAAVDLIWRSTAMAWEPEGELAQFVAGPTRGASRTVIPRVGQQAFKGLLLTAYKRTCAITGSHITPTLDAAHIRPVEHDGEHRLDNGLLLRTDVHRLFDAGLLGVDGHHRLQVSPHIRKLWGNGKEFYERQGEVIGLPDRRVDRPHKDFLDWHMSEVFKSA